MCAVALLVDEANTPSNAIIQRWFSEALLTGITQIARGALEAFVPFGWKANAFLDTIATIYNVKKQYNALSLNYSYRGLMRPPTHRPHLDPEYPFPFWLLHLA